jgi:hypothetical protein
MIAFPRTSGWRMNKVAPNLRCLEMAKKRFDGRAAVKSVEQIIEEERRR